MDKVTPVVRASGTIQKDTCIIIGLSGGPDSLCLLHVLKGLAEEMNLTLVPVHVNHQLRENADREEKHAESLCKKMGLECIVSRIDCGAIAEKQKISTEEAGRIARYEIFAQVAQELMKQGVPKEQIRIAVAHNADDQSETILQRIVRGTGLRGLVGIRPVRTDEQGNYIIRPLLDVPRSDIEEYIREHKLRANRDETNDSTDYTRNRIRLELIPYLEKNFNPSVKENLRTLGEIAAVDDNYMDQMAYAAYADAAEWDTAKEILSLDTERLTGQHLAILRRVIAAALRDLGLGSEISYPIIMGVLSILYSETPSARMDLPNGIVVERQYRKMIFRSIDTPTEPDLLDSLRLIVQVIRKEDFDPSEKRIYAAFDYDRFCKDFPGCLDQIVLRTRKAGDRIAIKGGKHKKLQDYMVDAKVPRFARDKVLMAAVGNEILWILPHGDLPTTKARNIGKYSQNYQIGDTTKEVLFLEIVDRL